MVGECWQVDLHFRRFVKTRMYVFASKRLHEESANC